MRLLKNILRSLAALLSAVLAALCITEFSPIYDFSPARPFEGPDIFNPYAGVPDNAEWKRANFHTHTKVDGPMNECSYTPDSAFAQYRRFGYDIVAFTNHNSLTVTPAESPFKVNSYEHGYNIFKYHKLVFGCHKVNHFDTMLPFLASQKQWELDFLGQDCDFIQMNHPYRTGGTSEYQMRRLSGYRIIELDSGSGTEQEYWDWALDAGRYSFALANDDLHHPDLSDWFAVRCNFLHCESESYEDVRNTLLSGAYYCMRVPDYGNGDWQVKLEKNAVLPSVTSIGAEGDTLHIALSAQASKITVTGQGHSILACADSTSHLEYIMSSEDNYARFTAYFEDGAVIYSNVFARYDASVQSSPFREFPHRVNTLLTIAYNILVLAVLAGLVTLTVKLLRFR